MRIDIHCHVVGKGRNIDNSENEVFFNPEDNQHWFTRILYNLLEDDIVRMGADLNMDGTISTDEYLNLLYRLLVTSEEIDAIVLLALDALFTEDEGELDRVKTDLYVSNRFLIKSLDALNEKLERDGIRKRFFFGASINPNRKDWIDEFEYILNNSAPVLIKLIPSVQHIDLMDMRHRDFYNYLSKHRIPLLCHVGPEYSFPEGIRKKRLDHFRNLESPLKEGVAVIAAHCATPVFPLIDKNFIHEFYSMMKNVNSDRVRLWDDTSALSISTRIPFIPDILRTFNPDWLIHGSDFPIPVNGWIHLPLITKGITFSEYTGIIKTKNPLDRDVRMKRAYGFSDSILSNAVKVLRGLED